MAPRPQRQPLATESPPAPRAAVEPISAPGFPATEEMLRQHRVAPNNEPEAGADRLCRRRALLGVIGLLVVKLPSLIVGALLLMLLVPAPALAQTERLSGILSRIQLVIGALLVGGATVALMVAGGRHLWGSAFGDPDQIEKAKQGIRAAAIGYALAGLAGFFVALLRYIVGA